MKKRDYLLVLVMLALDQLTKYIVSHSLEVYQKIVIIKNFFNITYVRNTGAAFSLFEGFGGLFSVFALGIALFIFYYLSKNKVSFFEKSALILLAAGALGNAIDRVVFNYVIDFLDFYIFGYDFPVFNVADIFITLSAVFIMLYVLFVKEEKKDASN